MQKLIGIFIMLFIGMNHIKAQQNTLGTTGKWGTQIFLSDANGKAFENKYADVAGSAYYVSIYKFSSIEMRDGKKYMDIKAKLNLVEHEVEFISASSREGFIGKGLVSLISFNDTVRQEVKKYTFQSGFPAIDNQTTIHFYQVLSNGKVTLLKSINKSMEERNNELSGERSKEFVSRENWYVYQNGVMKRVKKDQAFFTSLFADKAEAYAKYVNDNKVSFKNEDQIAKMVNFLNAL
jgi:hypothetical protein